MRNGRRILAMLLSGFLAVSSLHGLVFAEQTGQEPTAYENQEELPVPDTPEQGGDILDEENSEENLQTENEAEEDESDEAEIPAARDETSPEAVTDEIDPDLQNENDEAGLEEGIEEEKDEADTSDQEVEESDEGETAVDANEESERSETDDTQDNQTDSQVEQEIETVSPEEEQVQTPAVDADASETCKVTLDANGGYLLIAPEYFDGSKPTYQRNSFTIIAEKGEYVSWDRIWSSNRQDDLNFGDYRGPIQIIPMTEEKNKVFIGWALERDWEEDDEFRYGYTPVYNMTLFAVWADAYEVTFDANGGVIHDKNTFGQATDYTSNVKKVVKGDSINLFERYDISAPEGKILYGWSLTRDGEVLYGSSGFHESPAWTYVPSENCTLYAKYVNEKEQITFDANGGIFKDVEIDEDFGYFTNGRKQAVLNIALQNSRWPNIGYYLTNSNQTKILTGWSPTKNSTPVFSRLPFIDSEFYKVFPNGGPCTLYACWADAMFVTLDANGGFFGDQWDYELDELTQEKVRYGTILHVKVPKNVNLKDYHGGVLIEYPGRHFKGWALSRNGTPGQNKKLTDNCTLYAIWELDSDYTPTKAITLDKTSVSIEKGNRMEVGFTITGNRDVRWTSNNPSVADFWGVITRGNDRCIVIEAKEYGTATITGQALDGSGVKATCKVTVPRPKLTGLTLNKTKATINIGKTTTVSVKTVTPAEGSRNVTWKSSNTKVATVTSAGVVKGISKGIATITATAGDGSGVKAVCTVTVVPDLKKPGDCRFAKWNNEKYSSCRIAWNKVDYAEGYEALLSWTDGSHASSTIVKSNVLYRDCSVAVNHVSQMKARAFYTLNGKRIYGPWSNLAFITPSPTKLTYKNKSTGKDLKASISWNIIYGSNGYNVFLTTNPNGTWYWNQSTATKATETSAEITKYRGAKLKKNTRYYVRIVTRRQRNGVFCTVPMPKSSTNIGSFIIK